MFEIIENKFALGKETVYPFAAELHYFRVDKRHWSICFERIKRAGIRLITTAVPWNLHQDKNRDIDFVGYEDSRKDLTVFLELARELGFKIIIRPGPSIGPDWANSGIPEFVTSDLRSLARDSEGEVAILPGAPGVKDGYLPSYMSPAFQNPVKHYYKALVDVIRNYIHPRGPIIAIDFDHAPSFGGSLDPAASDYNEDMLNREYAPFLMDQYETIKELNSAYGAKYSDFVDVEPPREFKGASLKTTVRLLDWMRFKENLLQRYVNEQRVIYEGFTVHPQINQSLFFAKKDLTPYYGIKSVVNAENSESPMLLGAEISYDDSYADVARRGRYLRGSGGLSWAAAFPSGRAAADPAAAEDLQPITDGERRYLLSSALGSGFKGVNLRYFADHDRWYGAALSEDGSVTSGYEFVRRIVESAESIGLDELQADAQIALVGNRLYQWFARFNDPKDFGHIHRLVNESLPGLCRDLARLKLDYNICESGAISTLGNYKLVIIPSAEFMTESEQQAIIELHKSGVAIALFGAPPKYNESMAPCALLANYLKIKGSSVDSVKTIDIKTDKFPAYVYSSIKTTDTRAKKLAHADKDLVALNGSKKGALSFYGFDLSSGLDHHKLLYLEGLFSEAGVTSAVYCSDPLIDAVAHYSAKRVVIFLMAPPTGELGDRVETQRREVFLQVDLKRLGFKSPNIKIKDLFEDGEETPALKSTAQALSQGITLELDFPDGKALLIEKR